MKCIVAYTTPSKPDLDYTVEYKVKTTVSVFSKIRSELLMRQRIGCQITNISITYGMD